MILRPILTRLAIAVALLACGPSHAGEPAAAAHGDDVLHDYLRASLTADFVSNLPMDWKGAAGSASWQEASLYTPVWGHESGPWAVDVSLDYALHEFKLSSPAVTRHFNVQSIRAELDLEWASERSGWAILMDASPGVATDFEKGTTDEFNVEAAAALGYRWSRSLFIGISGEYTRSYGRPRLLPGVVILWQPSAQFHLEISPEVIEPQWRINERLRTSLVFVPMGGSWAIASPDGRPSRLTFSGAKAGIKIERRVLEKGWLHVEAGVNFSGNIKMTGSAPAPIINRDLKPAGYFGGGLRWDF